MKGKQQASTGSWRRTRLRSAWVGATILGVLVGTGGCQSDPVLPPPVNINRAAQTALGPQIGLPARTSSPSAAADAVLGTIRPAGGVAGAAPADAAKGPILVTQPWSPWAKLGVPANPADPQAGKPRQEPAAAAAPATRVSLLDGGALPSVAGTAAPGTLPPLVLDSPCTPIDLETALRRGGAANPTIAAALAAVQISLADQLLADVIAVPSINIGASYDWHQGNLLSSKGLIRNVLRDAFDAGLGAGARAAESVPWQVQGVRFVAPMANALFEPVATRYVVSSRRLDAAATNNNILLEVAVSYFDLAGAEAMVTALRQSEVEVAAVVQQTAKFAKEGQGRESDANRARADAELLESERIRAEEEVAVAAAQLARLLNVDPNASLRVPDGPLGMVQLVDPHTNNEELVQIALAQNPELLARTADVQVFTTRLREERFRPFLPTLFAGYSLSAFGGGGDQTAPAFGRIFSRQDVDVMAIWTLQGLGLGNLAIQRNVAGAWTRPRRSGAWPTPSAAPSARPGRCVWRG